MQQNPEPIDFTYHYGPQPINSLQSKARNQYTPKFDDDAIYRDLISNTRAMKSHVHSPNYCWILQEKTGLDQQNGYYKFNRDGKKVLAHRFVASLQHAITIPSDLDVSHLCHQKACIKPSHLVIEDRQTNLSRNSCKGWIIDKAFTKCYCHHTPKCKHIAIEKAFGAQDLIDLFN